MTALRSGAAHGGPRSPVLYPMLKLFTIITLTCFGHAFFPVLNGQESRTATPEPEHPYTLHVYEDLIQIPSLVMNKSHGPIADLQARDFTLRLDDGPPFHPRHVRPQGDDVVSFAVLLDNREGSDTGMIGKPERIVARLPPDLFRPADRLTVYALDCNLVRSVIRGTATRAALEEAMKQALHPPGLQGGAAAGSGTCTKRIQLWDALGAIGQQLKEAPGRRVLLAITDGVDAGSQNTWLRVRQYFDDYSIAVFGMRPIPLTVSAGGLGMPRGRWFSRAEEDGFDFLCTGTGGWVLQGMPDELSSMFGREVEMVRGRYILEFPRPSNGSIGLHQIDVSVPARHALVYTTGIGVPVADEKLKADPNTVPNDPTSAPVVGNRKILAKPQ